MDPTNECVSCNLCGDPGAFESAVEIAPVHSNVRAFQDESFTVWRCTGCGSLHSREPADLNRYYARYLLENQKLDYFYWCVCRNRLRMFRRQGVRRTDRILDYGCGNNGLFCEYLRSLGYSAVGYDPYAARFADASVLNEQYDVVASFDVIEHDDDPAAFFQRLAGLLKPGGLLFVGTPRADGIDLGNRRMPSLHQPYHRHILSEKVLLDLGERAGLDVVHVDYRWVADTMYPAVNNRFMIEYMARSGYLLNALVEPPNIPLVLSSPRLMFFALFGYCFPPADAIGVFYRDRR